MGTDVRDRPERCNGDGARARPSHARAAAAVALVALASFAGCGSGSDGSGGTSNGLSAAQPPPSTAQSAPPSAAGRAGAAGSEAQIRSAANAVLASGQSKLACSHNYVTNHYMTTTYGDTSGCEGAQLPGSAAKSLRISGVSITGRLATALAVPIGGPSDGERSASS